MSLSKSAFNYKCSVIQYNYTGVHSGAKYEYVKKNKYSHEVQLLKYFLSKAIISIGYVFFFILSEGHSKLLDEVIKTGQ